MRRSLVPLSRFLSLVLRHRPEAIGLTLDPQGWADVEDLLARAASRGRELTHEALLEIVETNDKQRFALSDDGTRIRALQGHSVDVDLGLEPTAPPDVLFHGTVERALAGIRGQGLLPGTRHHVHLSVDRETATCVGARRGEAVVLEIDAHGLAATGEPFYCSENGVWLVARVPAAWIVFP